MLHMKDKLFLKSELSDFKALVLHRAVVLLLFIHSCRGQSHLIGPTQTIVAMVGDDIVLPCHLEPSVDASDMTVEWSRPDLYPRFVYLRRDGVELLTEQNPSYKRRTSLSSNNLKCGDISLKLSKVKLSDEGAYTCLIPTPHTESVVEVTAGSVSSPDIKFSIVSNGVMLECKSDGWYPEPEVFWLDGEGNLLSAGPPETVRGPDDLYTVSSRVTVEKSNSFTCRVQQNNINQTRETRIHVPGDLFVVQTNSAVRIIICLAVCFTSVAAVVFVVWKRGQNKVDKTEQQKAEIKTLHDVELQLLMEGQRDGEQTLTEEMKHVDMKKAKLDEAFKRNEEELQHVQQVITTLMDQKKDLKNQREKLNSLLQDVKTQLKESEKKLKEKPKMSKVKKKSKRQETKNNLERRKAEHVGLLQNTEKLLETTEDMIIKMTEGKGKLEKDKEQINKQLKETKEQREEIQRKLSESEKKEEKHDQLSKDAE
ncbi:butyrophilin subfamily 3 member A2-like [Thunnus thynnus]|uniref:butyrophilin subfamily 3 member A2-like n=1 Tax=Thunnus thynnus TaxID=8237 RepID=UPI0035285E11